MRGGVILFRGTGADARRYVEADRARADDYYLGADASVAQFVALDGNGNVTVELSLDPKAYAAWVDWVHPVTGESMGKPRLAGEGRRGSPRFAEMVVNTPKSLSIAAALHPEVSDALDAAQQDAAAAMGRWLAQHSVTRVGPRGRQEVVHVEAMQTVAVTHRTSRAGDPHRHIHFQIGTRVWAAGAWRALDTAALFKQQGAIRALGTAVIAAHPDLANVLDRHGLTLDPLTGEVAELEPFNAVMSKRGEQVRGHLERFEAEWDAAHPGQTMGPVVSARLTARAWAHERPAKKPTALGEETAWQAELRDAGYDPITLRRPQHAAPVSLDDLSVQTIATRALDRCAGGASAWTRHTITEHITRIITGYGITATPDEVTGLIEMATRLAVEDCLSVLPPGTAAPEHVAHLTSLQVVRAETTLRDLLTNSASGHEHAPPDVGDVARAHGLDAGQERAAAAVASADPLVIVEGAAGAGKTTMLAVAIDVAREHGRGARLVAPTLRAAQVARDELGIPADSVAALVYAHGWRWNDDGVWTRLQPGDLDPDTGYVYHSPPNAARLRQGERVIVDEAGMLDQDTAIALFTIAAEAQATVALVGDRAQLAAVGRGGVLDIAADICGPTFDMDQVHRFTDPAYADLTLQMRDGGNPGEVFDQLAAFGLIQLHDDEQEVRARIATHHDDDVAVTVASNEQARTLNAAIRDKRTARGEVDDTRTVLGSDGLPIGRGDSIQTRRNDTDLGVANRQNWLVQHVDDDGALSVREISSGRKQWRTVRLPAGYVAQHTHLSYAATAYGVQGATMVRSHTILTDATSAATVYVGMTRGRDHNLLHMVADDLADARDQFITAMERDRADRGLDDARRRATQEVAGLVDHSPVELVYEEITALTKLARDAEQQARQWAQIAARLEAQTRNHAAEDAQMAAVVDQAREWAQQTRAAIRAPILAAAEADGRDYADATALEADAADREQTAPRLAASRARRARRGATEQARHTRARLDDRWGSIPMSGKSIQAWAAQVADRATDNAPTVVQATNAVAEAEHQQHKMTNQHHSQRRTLLEEIFGAEHVQRDPVRYEHRNPQRDAKHWAAVAQGAYDEIAHLRALSPQQASQRIKTKRAAADVARKAREPKAAVRTTRVRETVQDGYENQRRREPGRDDPARGL